MSFTVQDVAQLLKQAKENKKPYVFFTGAGCSAKADVPSATGLIKEICEKFPIQVKNIDHEKDKYNYGKYMSALDKDERRRLLKPHIIDNKKNKLGTHRFSLLNGSRLFTTSTHF